MKNRKKYQTKFLSPENCSSLSDYFIKQKHYFPIEYINLIEVFLKNYINHEIEIDIW